MENIDMFHAMVGFIFASVYENIPYKKKIEYDDFHASFTEIQDYDCLPWTDMYLATMNWLKKEGYIDFDSNLEGYVFKGVVITSNLFQKLSIRATSNDSKTIGDCLVEAVEAGNLAKVKQYGATAMFVTFKAAC